MPPQGEVARQWFISGEGIDRHVISTDIQRYLGNDATVRPGVGTGQYQGVQGFWIKAYRNLTSAMIADLRADSQRWRQEQRQTGGSGGSYENSRTYDQSNAARQGRRDGNNSPLLDEYGQRPGPGGPGRPADPMQIDPQRGQMPYGQNYPTPDGRGGQYPPDPSAGYRQPGRGQGYPDQAMVDTYGQPDTYGRFQVNPYGEQRPPQNYRAPQGPPTGYTQQGNYYVPMSSGYDQSGMMATAPPSYPQYDSRGQPMQQPGQPGRGGQPGYGQPNYPGAEAYPSPAQTIPDVSNSRNPGGQRFEPAGGSYSPSRANLPSGYAPYQQQYDPSGRPASGSGYGQQQQAQYAQEPNYPPQRESNARAQQVPAPGQQRDTDRRHRRNG